MKFNLIGTAFAADDPTAAATWFAEHFGFTVNVDIGWYVNAQHPDHPTISLDFVRRDHESWAASRRGESVAGCLYAFLVDDVDAEEARLRAAGLEIVLPLVSEPWGQRRFQVAGPEGLQVEVLQMVDPDPEWMAANGLG